MIFSFASGPLSMKISKKNLVIFALLCGFAGGILAFFFGSTSIYVLLGCSMLIGVAQGMDATMSMALIADYFVGEESR
ncbi:MFS transporter [Acetobacterium carbinolicum]|uniref:MFS transporter n=1 Tax=Acetobacterium carbinolicum TaxID=52690 RepID=UPI003BF5EF81